ncbi:hypothetical protein OG21DRAFT_1491533 [Imleria badia]|nr:hypothetical protein OG21DRAFT_1491533 [Imleria badia]
MLLSFLANEDQEENRIHRAIKIAVEKCPTSLHEGEELALHDSAPSSFYFVRPTKTPEGNFDYRIPSISVPTQTLLSLLAEGLKQQNNAIKRQFYHTMSLHAGTCTAARYIYENWFHSLFSSKKEVIECHWLSPWEVTEIIRGTVHMIQAAEGPSSQHQFYWIPQETNFTGIDSALVTSKAIIAFQVTIAKRHDSEPDADFQQLAEILPERVKHLPWRLVFIGMDEDRIKRIAKSFDKVIFFPPEAQHL